MLTLILQAARRRATTTNRSWTAAFRHLGAFGLFLLAILDSSPLPTFGGPDILIAILAASHRNPWYEYAAVATAGSLIGAYITFHLAQRAGINWLHRHFKRGRVPALMNLFDRWGTAALAVSTAVPLPFPTSMLFAVAGVSGYNTRKYMTVVGLCRAARYSLIGILADRYGRQFVRALRHPDQYWGWLLLFILVILGAVAMSIFVAKRLETTGEVVRVS